MKVGIITFHASHNYGSMLQAYALQQTVLRLGHECEIINLRTSIQKRYYLPFLLQPGKRKKAKAIIHPILAIDDVRKYWKFEKFLKDKYILSPRTYSTAEALKEDCLDYDFFISGSGHFRSLVVFQYILHLLVIIRFCNGSSTVGGNHSGHGFRIEVHAVILGMNLLGENRGYCHYYESESFHCCFVFG